MLKRIGNISQTSMCLDYLRTCCLATHSSANDFALNKDSGGIPAPGISTAHTAVCGGGTVRVIGLLFLSLIPLLHIGVDMSSTCYS